MPIPASVEALRESVSGWYKWGANKLSETAGRLTAAGIEPFLHAGYRGATSLIGFGPVGKGMKIRAFAGEVGAFRGFTGLGLSVGVGFAVGKLTGDPILGLAAGVAAPMALGLGPRFLFRWGLPMATFGLSLFEGYEQGGVMGAVRGGLHSAVEWGLWEAGIHAFNVALGGSPWLSAMSISSGGILLPALAVAALGAYSGYRFATYLRDRGRRARMSEMVGSMENFMTRNAITMRQRALQEISRSYTNSRQIFGNEAQLMHFM